ncbi:Paraquat-inducible protein B [hydrothermal vent metagenome]|uniref:Paraquat-inducible protein B n=1 Tax=hydrothermal vent metagenome TaxID=652676 RepID=A0A1W1EIL4_9ZZZZ
MKKPIIKRNFGLRLLTSIWIVPIIAFLISISLLYQHFSEKGKNIKIYFESSSGLKVKSKVRYRNVDIGEVTKILLDDDSDGVVVLVEMNKGTKKYLNNKTQFWIVKPKVDSNGISGLETLISGAYIGLYTQKDNSFKKVFQGLNEPYITRTNGVYYTLTTNKSHINVTPDSPVFYKNIEVGTISKVELNDDMSMNITILIESKYTKYINISSKFWIKSAVDINFENSNFNINLAPLGDILKGGLEFSTNFKIEDIKIPKDYRFTLYQSRSASLNKKLGVGGNYIKKFIMEFDDKMSHINQYASIKFNDYIVGEVTNIDFNYDIKDKKIKTRLDTTIDTSAFYDKNIRYKSGFDNLKDAVKSGLRARVDSENPITNTIFIDLDFVKNDKNRTIIAETNNNFIFPTYRQKESEMMKNLNIMMNKFKNLPIEELLISTTKLIDNSNKPIKNLLVEFRNSASLLNKILAQKDTKRLPYSLNKTMKELDKLIISIRKITDGDGEKSILASKFSDMLKQLTEASISMNKFATKLNKKPNSLIFGD